MDLWKCHLQFVFLSSIILAVVESQSVSVDPQVTAILGGKVVLRCQFIQGGSTASVTQIQWTKEPVDRAIAVFHPDYGKEYHESALKGRLRFTSSSVNDASISITHVNETDEGRYTCKYSTHPAGILKATTTLTVREQPWQNSAAMISGIVTALLIIVFTAAVVCFILMKRRQRCDRPTDSSTGNQAICVPEREDEDVNYADIRVLRPARGKAAILQSEEGAVYAAVKCAATSQAPSSTQPARGGGQGEVGDATYAQVVRA